MDFEFDPAKSASNKEKHGLDFIEAQALWLDEQRIEARARSHEEERWVLVATLGRPALDSSLHHAGYRGEADLS